MTKISKKQETEFLTKVRQNAKKDGRDWTTWEAKWQDLSKLERRISEKWNQEQDDSLFEGYVLVGSSNPLMAARIDEAVPFTIEVVGKEDELLVRPEYSGPSRIPSKEEAIRMNAALTPFIPCDAVIRFTWWQS